MRNVGEMSRIFDQAIAASYAGVVARAHDEPADGRRIIGTCPIDAEPFMRRVRVSRERELGAEASGPEHQD